MPLEKLKAAQQKAMAAGDNATAGMFSQVIKTHPENLVNGYRKAKADNNYDAAREIHKLYRGKKKPQSDADLYADPIFTEEAKTFYKADEGKDFQGTDEEAAKWALSRIGQFNYNLPQQVVDAVDSKGGKWGEQGSRAFLGLLERTDDLPNFTMDGTNRLVKGLATDFTNYLGLLGVGKVALGAGGKAAARAAILKQLTKGTAMDAGQELVDAGVEGLVKGGVRASTGATALKAAGTGAATGAGFGVADEVARQSVEQGAGSGEGYDPTRMVLPAMAGASLGGGVGGAIGAGVARGNSKRIKNVRRSLEDYAAGGDMRTAVGLQRNAIDAAGDAAKQAEARRLYDAGDVEGLDTLYQGVLKGNKTKMAGTEFNASVVKGVNQESMARGRVALNRLRALSTKGRIDGYSVGTAEAAFNAAKAPNAHYRAGDIQELIGRTNDPDAVQALSVLAAEAKSAAQTVQYRTIRGQQSRLREFIENPLFKVAADFTMPGGSTGTTIAGKVAEGVGRHFGVMTPPPARMLNARSAAMSRDIPDVLKKAYQADAKKVGKEIRDLNDMSKRLANARSGRPSWGPNAGVPPLKSGNGLATSAREVGMDVQKYVKAVKEFQAESGRPEIQFYGDELLANGRLPQGDFYKFQNEMARWLESTGRMSKKELQKHSRKAANRRIKVDAVKQVIAERALLKAKVAQGVPLTSEEARRMVVYRATKDRNSAKAAIARAPIPSALKSQLRSAVDDIANAKTKADKQRQAAMALARISNEPPAVQQLFIATIKPLLNYGK
jgi:hypothetical protein